MFAYYLQEVVAYCKYMTHKFLADSMAGDVARNMRMLGHDTEHYPHMTQYDTLQYAQTAGRIILTKNQWLLKQDVCTVYATTTHGIMKKIVETFGITTDIVVSKSRCSICNGEQRDIGDTRRQCTLCGKIYWDGTHIEHMRQIAKTWR